MWGFVYKCIFNISLSLLCFVTNKLNRVAVSIGYYQLLPDIIGYCPCAFKIYELSDGKNVWKQSTMAHTMEVQKI